MATYGKKHCDFLGTLVPTTDPALAATYYNGEGVHWNISDSIPAQAAYFAECAQVNERAYRDYVVRNNGSVPGYWIFSGGLYQDFKRTGDTVSKDAVHMLATNGSYCADTTPESWTANATRSREVSYCLTAYVNDERLGVAHRARADLLLNQALAMVPQWTQWQVILPLGSTEGPPECQGNYYLQPFMMALLADTLRQVHAFKPDSRIPPAIKEIGDFIKANSKGLNSQTPFYENCKTSPASASAPWIFPTKGPAPDLALLIAPVYAWLWNATGDVQYRDYGDALWSDGVKNAYIEQPKQFNQNYFWSFEYVKWRSAAPAPITFAKVPKKAITKPAPLPKDMPAKMKSTLQPFPEK